MRGLPVEISCAGLLRFHAFRMFRLRPGLWEELTKKETEAQQEKVSQAHTKDSQNARASQSAQLIRVDTMSFPVTGSKSILRGCLAFQSSDCFYLTVSDIFAKDHEAIQSNVHRTQQRVSEK